MGVHSTYLGRVGRAYDSCVRILNDMKSGDAAKYFPPLEFLDAINRSVMRELAINDYWETSGYIDFVADQEAYDLRALFPGFVRAKNVTATDTGIEVSVISDADRYQMVKKHISGSGPYGIYIKTDQLHVLPVPTANADNALIIGYSYSPPRLGGGTEIALGNAAVVDRGGGVVGIAATAHGLETNEEITITGTTNYNGTHIVQGVTTNEIRILATYVAETIPTTALCGRYYTPKWPEAYDNILIYGGVLESGIKDLGRRQGQYQELFRRYSKAKSDVLGHGYRQQRMTLRPVR